MNSCGKSGLLGKSSRFLRRIQSEDATLLDVDEGRKRVIGIMAAILVTRHFRTPEDLVGTAQGDSPRSDRMIVAAVQWAERIMNKIDFLTDAGARKGWPT